MMLDHPVTASAFPLYLKAVGGAVTAVAAGGASDKPTVHGVAVGRAGGPCQGGKGGKVNADDCFFHFSSPS
jgi:hypothetical protein